MEATAAEETRVRRRLALVALGRAPADRLLRVGRLLDVHTGTWRPDQDIAIAGNRIAWVGDAGTYTGNFAERIERPHLAAVPGFGEVHKHIESSHLTPEFEAALVLPHGNTWTCEASHELSNVIGPRNLEFWLEARKRGSPLKIFPLPGSAVPPTAWETSGGHYGAAEQAGFMADPRVVGLDEVMDWPAVWDAANPAHDRLWGMIEATMAARGVVEGHGAGLTDPASISAYAAAGLASDHEVTTTEEVWQKLTRGIVIELRVHAMEKVIPGLLTSGLSDWSQIAFATDDRSASDTLRLGATDHNVRTAIGYGLAPEVAIACVTINPARHMRLTPWVGSVSPGRYADIVLLRDVPLLDIAEVWADGRPVAIAGDYTAPIPAIAWPAWATRTVKVGRELTADDFRVTAAPGRATMQAAVLRPFHWADDFLIEKLPVSDGAVQRDAARTITKFAVVDRHTGQGAVARMFWRGCGPATEGTALASSLAHDTHNIWTVGSCDAAMAQAVNAVAAMQGGWALVVRGKLAATVRYEIGGLMTARPAAALDTDMQALYRVAESVEWMHEPTFSPRWPRGFPERLAFATLTCSPWRWVLVAPTPAIPEGLVNVRTGETHPVVW
jgi:adenine deaminase